MTSFQYPAFSESNGKTCLKRPLKNSQSKGLDDNWYMKLLMKVESIAEWPHWSILQYF